MTTPHVSTVGIIVVNWNSGDQLRSALQAIERSQRHSLQIQVVVVDNASTDRSFLVETNDLPVTILRQPVNLGFAAACNLGAASLPRVDYLLFLNPDTRVSEDAIAESVKFLEDPPHHEYGIVGPRMVQEGGTESRSCARFPSTRHWVFRALGLTRLMPGTFEDVVLSAAEHSASGPVDHVIGAFFFVRREVFDALGGFDELFFVYLEDLDLSLRAHQLGWRSYYLREVHVVHKGGGTTENVKGYRLFCALRSRNLYVLKHSGRWPALLVTGLTLFVEPFVRQGYAIFRLDMEEVAATAQGYTMLWRDLPNWFPRGWRARTMAGSGLSRALGSARG